MREQRGRDPFFFWPLVCTKLSAPKHEWVCVGVMAYAVLVEHLLGLGFRLSSTSFYTENTSCIENTSYVCADVCFAGRAPRHQPQPLPCRRRRSSALLQVFSSFVFFLFPAIFSLLASVGVVGLAVALVVGIRSYVSHVFPPPPPFFSRMRTFLDACEQAKGNSTGARC
jgi:hypothetical protein